MTRVLALCSKLSVMGGSAASWLALTSPSGPAPVSRAGPRQAPGSVSYFTAPRRCQYARDSAWSFPASEKRGVIARGRIEVPREVPTSLGLPQDLWDVMPASQKQQILKSKGMLGQQDDTEEGRIAREKKIAETYTNVLIRNQDSPDITTHDFVASATDLQERLQTAISLEYNEQNEAMSHIYGAESTDSLKQQGLCLTDLRAKRTGKLYSGFVYDLGPIRGSDFHRFQRGDNIILATIMAGTTKDPVTLNGVVGEVRSTHITVVLERDDSVMLDNVPGRPRWRMDQKLVDTSFKRQQEALRKLPLFREKNNDLKPAGALAVHAALLGVSSAEELASRPPRWATSEAWRAAANRRLVEIRGLNKSQQVAIASALTRSVSLWQGPPGTGKTRTMLSLIDVLCSASKEASDWRSSTGQILVVADTNAAVDNLLEGLLERGVSSVRVGNPAKIREDLRWASLEALAEKNQRGQMAAGLRAKSEEIREEADAAAKAKPPPDIQELRSMYSQASRDWKKAQRLMDEALVQQLEESQVVLCTCSGAGSQLLEGKSFRVVLIDEATQATEPSTLVPLMKGSECCVLAGDPKQLPPTVVSSQAVAAGLTETLFARLEASTDIPVLLLDRQYRMHPAINTFPSKVFYGGKVESGIPASQRPPPSGLRWPNPKIPVALLRCSGRESTSSVSGSGGGSGNSYSNREEAELVLRVTKALLAPGDLESVALLTPYNGQVRLLQQMVRASIPEGLQHLIRISSVDGFQGQEADAVVFSTVRSNKKGSIGFVSDLRRMNVAITRPRRGLVIVGDPETLKSNKYWSLWIKFISGKKVNSVMEPTDIPLVDDGVITR